MNSRIHAKLDNNCQSFIETHEPLTEARLDVADGRAKMDIDNRIASKRIIETLREWILKLEDTERSGAGTPDTCDMHVCLQQMLDELDRLLERSHKQLN